MQNIQHINIPISCNQSWQDMTPETEGRHCSHCSKIVTDFSILTNSQIINRLAASSNICGKIDRQQLITINQQLSVEGLSFSSSFKSWMVAIGLLVSMSFLKAEAQTKPVVEQSAGQPLIKCNEPILGKMIAANQTRVIKGVVSEENNLPVPGVSIINNQNIVTKTNVSGEFVLHVTSNVQQFGVSFIGYTTQIVAIKDTIAVYQIKIKKVPQMMGEVVIMKRPSFIKRTYNKCIKRPIYKLFK
jgi:hypothetical protein